MSSSSLLERVLTYIICSIILDLVIYIIAWTIAYIYHLYKKDEKEWLSEASQRKFERIWRSDCFLR